MVNYVVISKSPKEARKSNSAQIGNHKYGICACSFNNGLLDIKNCVLGVSDDIAWMRALADKLNIYGVDSIHLFDIIEDELYSLRS